MFSSCQRQGQSCTLYPQRPVRHASETASLGKTGICGSKKEINFRINQRWIFFKKMGKRMLKLRKRCKACVGFSKERHHFLHSGTKLWHIAGQGSRVVTSLNSILPPFFVAVPSIHNKVKIFFFSVNKVGRWIYGRYH